MIGEIYRRAGRELTAQRQQAMRTWDKNNPQGQFGKYSYNPENYGLTREAIDRAFSDCIQRFIR